VSKRKRSRPVPEVFLFLFLLPVYHTWFSYVKFLVCEFSQVGEMFTGFCQVAGFGYFVKLGNFCVFVFFFFGMCGMIVLVSVLFRGLVIACMVGVDTKKRTHVFFVSALFR